MAEDCFGVGVADGLTGFKVSDGLAKVVVAVCVERFFSWLGVNDAVEDPCSVLVAWLVSSDMGVPTVMESEGSLVLSSPAMPKGAGVPVKVALGRKGVRVDIPFISRSSIFIPGLQAAKDHK